MPLFVDVDYSDPVLIERFMLLFYHECIEVEQYDAGDFISDTFDQTVETTSELINNAIDIGAGILDSTVELGG